MLYPTDNSQELTLTILMYPFQLRILCDSVFQQLILSFSSKMLQQKAFQPKHFHCKTRFFEGNVKSRFCSGITMEYQQCLTYYMLHFWIVSFHASQWKHTAPAISHIWWPAETSTYLMQSTINMKKIRNYTCKHNEIYNLREVFLLYNSIKVINVIKLCLVALSVQ